MPISDKAPFGTLKSGKYEYLQILLILKIQSLIYQLRKKAFLEKLMQPPPVTNGLASLSGWCTVIQSLGNSETFNKYTRDVK